MFLRPSRATAAPGILVLSLVGSACAPEDTTGADAGGSEAESSGDGDGDPGDGDGDPGDGDGDGEPEAVCGDGSVDGDEQCDDANGNDNDACTNACTLAVCGDGVVGPGEVCDLGPDNGPDSACSEVCATADVCGDGIVGPTEGCDDGNDDDGDACTNACALATCGDGSLGPGEPCDDGNTSEIDACSNLCVPLPVEPGALTLDINAIKQFSFSWSPVFGATYYQVLERAKPGAEYVQVGNDVVGEALSLTVPLHLRAQATYKLRACNEQACSESAPIDVASNLAEAVGYVKASTPKMLAQFGEVVAVSADGRTVAVGARQEDGSVGAAYVYALEGEQWVAQARLQPMGTQDFGTDLALSADGDTLVVGAPQAGFTGSTYVFAREQGEWTQAASLQGSNTEFNDYFGWSVALAADGDTLAVGAFVESSNATGIGGDQADNSAPASGAVYVFVRDNDAWVQQAYIKASNAGAEDGFGFTVALAANGDTLAVGAPYEDSNATGVDGTQANNSASFAGAAYVFVRAGDTWSQQAYVKATNTQSSDYFGEHLAISSDGDTLIVASALEDSAATGIDGDQADNSAAAAGAVYVYARSGEQWAPQAYMKAPNTDAGDRFGTSVALSDDGARMAIGALGEDGGASGLGGDPADDSRSESGAVYVFELLDGQWIESSYVKASTPDSGDQFGGSVALSGDGTTLVVAAPLEDSNAAGIGGDQTDNSLGIAGAVYLF